MTQTTRIHLRGVPILALLILLGACQVEPGSESQGDLGQWSSASAMADARHDLEELAHDLAVALGDQGTRARLLTEFRGSRHQEGKVDAEHLVMRRTNGLGAAIAARAGRPESDILPRIRSFGRLEIYLPVKAHRDHWNGGADVIVATSLTEDETPIGFDTEGRPVELSLNAPPDRPVIAIVPAESPISGLESAPATSTGPQFATCGEDCTPPCSGDTCGGTGDDGSSGGDASAGGYTAFTQGIYMNYLHMSDLHEPWIRGSPEIEVMLIGPTEATGQFGAELAGIPAGETVSAPRMFNMNYNTWEQGGNGVLVASKADLDRIRSQYPDWYPDSMKAFAITVWEDDLAPGIINDPASKYNAAIVASGMVLAGYYWAVYQEEQWGGAIFALGALALLKTSIGANAFGGEDDFAGTMVTGAKWFEATGQATEHSHAVVLNNHRDGTATLTYRTASQ